ncbi:phage terminase small subunit P27 family [Weissella paramesenteroides]|uniref:phage terminase small subunit P27 family n=1 Tax=Weissella paramesenteroides TaxID=1249 RepID=UPI001238F742|nr:phage terminase small subunit P27 family [Weissella paramesenteroides]KAA8445034.1 phage terminase small subunit P27 family [Weissella paramesenteroides]KAA8452629.1 phage terminase small subunit P27 family [Weissella paramesenteroides]
MKKADKDINGGTLSYRPPDYLGRQAKVIWRKVVVFLEENSAVNRVDSNLVEMYCTQYEIYRNAYKHIRENGEVQAIYKPVQDFEGNVIDRTFQGYKRNPMTSIYSDSIKNLAKIGSELGLSPASRAELLQLSTNTSKSKTNAVNALKELLEG